MEFLLEINTEEMPSSHVKTALEQLKEKFRAELSSSNISISELRTLGTCRRLVVLGDFAQSQENKEEVVIGPPKTVAFAPDGSPLPAAKGFAKAQEVSIEELQVIKTEKGEYLSLRKIEKGKPTKEILAEIVPQIILSLSFPKMMRWGESSLRFSRPIKNILCLFGERPLAFQLENLVSTDSTSGHRLHFPQKIRVKSFREYKETLKEKKVLVEEEERRRMILAQIEKKLAPLKAEIFADEELLERLVYDVEYPYVFLGSFPEEYLRLPLEVLSTAMKEGQRLFSVIKERKQLPYFLGVADTFRDSRSLVQKGNERVLRARLEDARFFWEHDLKSSLKEKAPELKKVIFQEKLGSYDDKSQRLKKIVGYLCDKIDAQKIKKELIQAAELCKADLVTEMVREFPSLQGKIGGLYAKEKGYPQLISQAIYEQYKPVGLEDESPSSLAGAILSLADKLDSIMGVVGIGIQMTGSSDPFGLRRNAHGVCKIILDRKLCFSFSRLLDKVLEIYGEKLEKTKKEIKEYCLDFFLNRLRYIYEKKGYRYDLVNAAFGAGIDNIYYSFLRVKALDSLKTSPQFEPLILMAKRVNNILRDQPLSKINPDLFFEKEEREIYSIFSIIKENASSMISKGDFSQAQKIIFRIQPSLNNFFDHVLVMAEEKKIRQNRLALLQAISKLLWQIADYSQVVVEGEK